MWVFIIGDMLMFTILFGVYLYYRGKQPELFEAGQETLDQSHGVINTLLLLVSSLFVAIGVQAIRRRENGAAKWLFYGAIACGFGFIVMKIVDYTWILSQGEDYSAVDGDFYGYYFLLTGMHFLHLLIGMIVLFYILHQTRRPEQAIRNVRTIEGGACYWHMVDLLWIIIFPLLFLVA